MFYLEQVHVLTRVTLIKSMRHVHLPSHHTAFDFLDDHSLQRVWRATLFETLPWAAASDSHVWRVLFLLGFRYAGWRTEQGSAFYQIIEGFWPPLARSWLSGLGKVNTEGMAGHSHRCNNRPRRHHTS